jgi:hypothetical protein
MAVHAHRWLPSAAHMHHIVQNMMAGQSIGSLQLDAAPDTLQDACLTLVNSSTPGKSVFLNLGDIRVTRKPQIAQPSDDALQLLEPIQMVPADPPTQVLQPEQPAQTILQPLPVQPKDWGVLPVESELPPLGTLLGSMEVDAADFLTQPPPDVQQASQPAEVPAAHTDPAEQPVHVRPEADSGQMVGRGRGTPQGRLPLAQQQPSKSQAPASTAAAISTPGDWMHTASSADAGVAQRHAPWRVTARGHVMSEHHFDQPGSDQELRTHVQRAKQLRPEPLSPGRPGPSATATAGEGTRGGATISVAEHALQGQTAVSVAASSAATLGPAVQTAPVAVRAQGPRVDALLTVASTTAGGQDLVQREYLSASPRMAEVEQIEVTRAQVHAAKERGALRGGANTEWQRLRLAHLWPDGQDVLESMYSPYAAEGIAACPLCLPHV